MGFIYFDESKHKNANFVLGAFVYSETDLGSLVENALINNNYDPNNQEFKSCLKFANDKNAQNLKQDIYSIFLCCRLGILIAPYQDHQRNLEKYFQEALNEIKRKNSINEKNFIFVDEGIFSNKYALIKNSTVDEYHLRCNSKKIKGIQIADYAAHCCAIHLKDRLGLIAKSSRDPTKVDLEDNVNLAFEMFARTRCCFFIGRSISD